MTSKMKVIGEDEILSINRFPIYIPFQSESVTEDFQNVRQFKLQQQKSS